MLGVGLAVFLQLVQSRVDILDDDLLNVETLDHFTDHSDSIASDELHAQTSAGTALIVFSM